MQIVAIVDGDGHLGTGERNKVHRVGCTLLQLASYLFSAVNSNWKFDVAMTMLAHHDVNLRLIRIQRFSVSWYLTTHGSGRSSSSVRLQ